MSEHLSGVETDRPLRIYTAGPMTGLKNHNVAAFTDAKTKLERKGFEVLSPAENFGGAVVESLRSTYMRRDFFQVLRADAVVVLPGWNDSNGAKAEVIVAREIGIPILSLDDLSEITDRVVLTVEPMMSVEWPAVDSDRVTKGG